ncbi:MAG: hypothetical protein AB7L92_07265 [Alphaproteobacteria bacterium]
MAKRIMQVQGFDGVVTLLSDRVVIERPGAWNFFKYGFNSKREIPLSAVSEVVLKPPLLLGMGSIEFVRMGRSENERLKTNYSLVKFKKLNYHNFEMLKEKIFEIMDEYAHQTHKMN